MDNKFDNLEEKLFRAVLPDSMYWKDEKTISSAALKERKGKGLSVDRTGDRTEEEAKLAITKKFKGKIVSLKVMDCNSVDVNAVVCYLPIEEDSEQECNPYHCEIHGSKEKPELSKSQAKALARKAVLEVS